MTFDKKPDTVAGAIILALRFFFMYGIGDDFREHLAITDRSSAELVASLLSDINQEP